MTAFFGFGATPPRWRGSLLARARSPLVPLCIAPHACATAPGSRPVGCPADVGPEGHPPFLGRIFRACTQPGTGPVLHPSPHTLQHTTPESGRSPGDPAGPGWIFSHRSSVFPSFGDSFGVPHPGILCWTGGIITRTPETDENRPPSSDASTAPTRARDIN